MVYIYSRAYTYTNVCNDVCMTVWCGYGSKELRILMYVMMCVWQFGADMEVKNYDERTPYEVAEWCKHEVSLYCLVFVYLCVCVCVHIYKCVFMCVS